MFHYCTCRSTLGLSHFETTCRRAQDGSCQDDEGFQCGGKQFPCLPHWKFDDDLTGIIGKARVSDDSRFDIDWGLTGVRRLFSKTHWFEPVHLQ